MNKYLLNIHSPKNLWEWIIHKRIHYSLINQYEQVCSYHATLSAIHGKINVLWKVQKRGGKLRQNLKIKWSEKIVVEWNRIRRVVGSRKNVDCIEIWWKSDLHRFHGIRRIGINFPRNQNFFLKFSTVVGIDEFESNWIIGKLFRVEMNVRRADFRQKNEENTTCIFQNVLYYTRHFGFH